MKLENEIQAEIIKYLRRRGNMVVKLEATNVVGIPDLLVVSPIGKYTWLEVKTETGRLSEAQAMIAAKLNKYNCSVHVVRSLEDVKEVFGD